jgi:hypothetical protein
MEVPMIIPQDFLVILAAAATAFAHWLRSKNLSNEQNAMFAGTALLICGTVTAWMVTGFSPDIKADFLLVCSSIVSLAATGKEFLELLNYLQDATSPLEPAPSAIIPPVRRASAPITLPASPVTTPIVPTTEETH